MQECMILHASCLSENENLKVNHYIVPFNGSISQHLILLLLASSIGNMLVHLGGCIWSLIDRDQPIIVEIVPIMLCSTAQILL